MNEVNPFMKGCMIALALSLPLWVGIWYVLRGFGRALGAIDG